MEKEEQQLIDSFVENSVDLQKVLAETIISMNRLTNEIQDLVSLFKEAAKTTEESKDKEILSKIESLAEQNKTIAKSMTLMLEKEKPRSQPLPEYKF
jgi:glutamate synthase domain-containing protein 3